MRLENTDPGHYKFFELNMLESPDDAKWVVLARWGTIGTRTARKAVRGKGSFEECHAIFNKILKKRYKHGYKKVETEDKDVSF